MKYSRLIFAALIIALGTVFASAQPTSREAAIRTYLEGKDLEAILAFEELIKQKQYASDAELINYLGLAYQNALDAKGARKMFEKAVKLQPASSNYRVNLAYSYLLERKINRSQQQAEKALQLDPSNVSAYYVLGRADLWERKTEDAMRTAEKMITLDPGFPPGYTAEVRGPGRDVRGKIGGRLDDQNGDRIVKGIGNGARGGP